VADPGGDDPGAVHSGVLPGRHLGQVNRIFNPANTPFLHGQHYVAFQIRYRWCSR